MRAPSTKLLFDTFRQAVNLLYIPRRRNMRKLFTGTSVCLVVGVFAFTGTGCLFARNACLEPTVVGTDRPAEADFFEMCKLNRANGAESEWRCWNGYEVRCVDRETRQPLHPENMKIARKRKAQLEPSAFPQGQSQAGQTDPAQEAIWKACLSDCWEEHCKNAPTARTKSNCAENCHRRCGSTLKVVP